MKKVKLGIAAADILAIVFLILGGIFTLLGTIFALNYDTLLKNGTGDTRVVPIAFLGVGLPFLLGGFCALAYTLHRHTMVQRAVDEGYFVLADVDHIVQNTSITINGSNPFFVVCRYQDPDTHDMHEFRSRNLTYYPKELLDLKIRVYVLKEQMKYYYVDIDDAFHEELQ